MALTIQDPARTAIAAAICGLADAGAGPATIQIGTASFASILATFTCSDPAYTPGAAGVQTLDVTPALSVNASASGTAAVWRLRDSNSADVFTGNVAATADGSDLTLTTNARNAACSAVNTAIGTSGHIQIATDSTFTTVLATLPLSATAFGAPATGAMTLNGTPQANATNAGVAGAFRFRTSGNVEIYRGVVTGTGGGGDLEFSNTTFGVGSTITINTYTYTHPATSASSIGVMVFAGGVAITSGETIEISSGSFTTP